MKSTRELIVGIIVWRTDSVHKRMIIDLFKNEILPWWEYEVVNHVVDGTTRKFNVYLVSNN
jgi:hypothetical protein